MSTGIRRSSRATKGQTSKLNYEQEMEIELELLLKKRLLVAHTNGSRPVKKPKSGTQSKSLTKPKTSDEQSSDEDDSEDENELAPVEDSDDEFVGSDLDTKDDDNMEETVRCLVCGATDENYDEETDTLGAMVECCKCKTWQHCKCMFGHQNIKKIPDDYVCNVCDPALYPNLKLKLSTTEYKKTRKQQPPIDKKLSFNKIRLSVAQTFHNLFTKLISKEKDTSADELDLMAQELSIELEQLIFNNYSMSTSKTQPPGQKYSEKSRSLYANLKDEKNILFKQVLDHKLTMNELSLMSPQELLNPDLQKFSKEVMAQLIQDSVLKPLQKPKFKKTHKGDELVEDDYIESSDVTTTISSVLREASKSESPDSATSTQPTDVEEPEEPVNVHRPSLINLNDPIQEEEEGADNTGGARDYADVGLDDDLDNILNDKKESSDDDLYDPLAPSIEKEPPQFWKGELTFPGICNFESKMTFLSTTNNVSFDKELLSTKMIMDNFKVQNLLEVEGRLNMDQLIGYLSKILKSRYLNICDLTFTEDASNFQRLFHYFNNKQKVGVIGNRPDFVKDCYLLTFDKDTIKEFKESRITNQNLNTLFNSFKQNIFENKEEQDTILVVFVVKHNFESDLNNRQILKKLPLNFYKLTSTNQQKFMEIIQLSEKSGKRLNEFEVERLVENLLPK